MDHRYIDDHSVAGRYLDHTLSTVERLEFESHLVDCQECADRLLLAEMFHHRNGGAHRRQLPSQELPAQQPPSLESVGAAAAQLTPRNIRLVFWNRRFWPWQLLLILAVGAAVVMLAASALVLLAARL